MPPALRSKNDFNVLASTPSSIFLRAPCVQVALHLLITKVREKCGLARLSERSPHSLHPVKSADTCHAETLISHPCHKA
jgi:hypothetical protein